MQHLSYWEIGNEFAQNYPGFRELVVVVAEAKI